LVRNLSGAMDVRRVSATARRGRRRRRSPNGSTSPARGRQPQEADHRPTQPLGRRV